jgi:hypothetical protein
MKIVIDPSGIVRCVYDETISLHALGRMKIRRGSHVEPIDGSKWIVDLSLVGGPTLGPFVFRSKALAAERRWLEKHWLSRS